MLRTLRIKRDLSKRFKARKALRGMLSEAARRGQETQLRNRIARHKQTWGQ